MELLVLYNGSTLLYAVKANLLLVITLARTHALPGSSLRYLHCTLCWFPCVVGSMCACARYCLFVSISRTPNALLQDSRLHLCNLRYGMHVTLCRAVARGRAHPCLPYVQHELRSRDEPRGNRAGEELVRTYGL